jgi:glycosyltransferase involved in cell wall biosynthesis
VLDERVRVRMESGKNVVGESIELTCTRSRGRDTNALGTAPRNSKAMKFTVVIAAYRVDTIASAIESILQQSHTEWELFVVSQADRYDTRDVVRGYAARDDRVKSLHIPRAGTSRARNEGAKAGAGEVIAILDDDCEASTDWLAQIAVYFDEHPDVGLIGGSVVAPAATRSGHSVCPTFIPVESVYDPRVTPKAPPAGWDWIGCNVGIRRHVMERIGPMDPNLGPGTDFPAGEDTDYKLRLETAGIPMGASPRIVVNHTYGRRYGLKAGLRNSKNYAYGNGGLAGKLSLLGDPRGREWVLTVTRDCLTSWLTRPRVLPEDLNRWWNYLRAYRLALRKYETQGGLLELKR